MKKHLVMTAILAFGMGLAQAQTPAPMQGGAPNAGTKRSPQEAPVDRGSSTVTASGTALDQATAAPQSFKGCLTGSSGNWSLASDNGQTLKVSGTDSQLSNYNNQQVNIQGTQTSDGAVSVASIDKISESCNATGQAATSTEQNTATSQSPAASSTSTQPPASTTGQGATSTGQSATSSGQTSGEAAVPHISDMDQNQAGNQAAGQKLPQTASPLPLLGLMGLGSLVTGLMARRKK